MKKREFKTSKGEFLVVEFPSGIIPVRGSGIERSWAIPTFPEGKWGCVCRCDEADKKKAKDIVEEPIKGEPYRPIGSTLIYPPEVTYFNYVKQCWWAETCTPMESLNSLFESIGVLWENPYRDPGLRPSAELDAYRKAKENVFDKSCTYLFKKV